MNDRKVNGMANQINITIDDNMMEHIIREAGKRMTSSGKRCSLSVIVSEICMPALEAYFNRHDPISVSPPEDETKSQDDSQDDSQNVTEDAPTMNRNQKNVFNFMDIDF